MQRSIFSVSRRGGGSRGTYSKASKSGDDSDIEDAAVCFFQEWWVSMEFTPHIICSFVGHVYYPPLSGLLHAGNPAKTVYFKDVGRATQPSLWHLCSDFVIVSLKNMKTARLDHPQGPLTPLSFTNSGSTSCFGRKWKKCLEMPWVQQAGQRPSELGKHHLPYYPNVPILPVDFLP